MGSCMGGKIGMYIYVDGGSGGGTGSCQEKQVESDRARANK